MTERVSVLEMKSLKFFLNFASPLPFQRFMKTKCHSRESFAEMFVAYLQEKGLLCHGPNDIRVGPNRQLFCQSPDCNRLILDVNKQLTEVELPSCASYLAKHYAQWTGDLHVPCRITIKDIPGIKPDYVEISYFNLLNTIELLGAVNQEFIACKNHHFNVKETLKAKILENFIDYYMNMVDTLEHEQGDIEKILKAILKQMKDSFNTQDYNIFEYYFKVICPYVKTIDSSFREETLEVHSPAEFFLHLSQNASEIRKQRSPYCLPFDITYIMIYCFACHRNLDVVANFVFDLIARLCTQYFDPPTFYHQACKNTLHSLIGHDSNTPLYYLTKEIQKGQASDLFSLDFYGKFAHLQQLLFAEFARTVSTPSDTITKFAFAQSFPFILFPNSLNYYGFMCMMGYATSKLNLKNNARFEKGTCAHAKEIFHFIESYAKRIETFANGTYIKVSDIRQILLLDDHQLKFDIMRTLQQSGQDLRQLPEDAKLFVTHRVEFWTLDYFNLFVSTDEDILKHLAKFMDLLIH